MYSLSHTIIQWVIWYCPQSTLKTILSTLKTILIQFLNNFDSYWALLSVITENGAPNLNIQNSMRMLHTVLTMISLNRHYSIQQYSCQYLQINKEKFKDQKSYISGERWPFTSKNTVWNQGDTINEWPTVQVYVIIFAFSHAITQIKRNWHNWQWK